MKKVSLFLIAALLVISAASIASAKHLHEEKYYQLLLAKELSGETEYLLSDKSRVDILSSRYAIETDFTSKVYESFGQARYYSIMTKKEPGVQLVEVGDATRDKDAENKLFVLIKSYNKPFHVWIYNRLGTCILDKEF